MTGRRRDMATLSSPPPRDIRNHNPLDIRLNPSNRWQGRVDPARNTDGVFERFQDAVWGLRAAAVLIIAHYDRRGGTTITGWSGCGHRRRRTTRAPTRPSWRARAVSESISRSTSTDRTPAAGAGR